MSQESQFSINWINGLYRIGRAVAGAENRAASHQGILDHLTRGFIAASGCLALTESDNRTLRIVAGLKLPAGVIGSLVGFGDRILGWVAANALPVLLDGDVSKDKRFQNLKARNESGIPMVAMCLPLRVEGRVVGVLSLNRQKGDPPFLAQDLEHATHIADLVAIVIENAALHADQARRISELTDLNARLQETQSQLMQSEKMASVGQLAAGVAHEINNPVGYIASNLGILKGYVESLLEVVNLYEVCKQDMDPDSEAMAQIREACARTDLDYLRTDVPLLVRESLEGVSQVKKIIQDLKEFSHVDRAEWQEADLHKGLDSTLNIVRNELKYKVEIVKEYGELPLVECIPSQINQVFINLLVNAGQAIESNGVITLRSGCDGDQVWVEVADNGKGMPPEVMKRIFDPFYTTKPVGKGTGLGLSLSYGIVQKHNGMITVNSVVDRGTTFLITMPVRRTAPENSNPQTIKDTGS